MKLRQKLLIVLLLAVLSSASSNVYAAPGDVDLSFNPQISSFGFGPYIYAVRIQPDGKSVIAGCR